MIDPNSDPMKHAVAALEELAKLVDIEDEESEEYRRQAEKARETVSQHCAELIIEEAMCPSKKEKEL